jgi:hypothetical protein
MEHFRIHRFGLTFDSDSGGPWSELRRDQGTSLQRDTGCDSPLQKAVTNDTTIRTRDTLSSIGRRNTDCFCSH